MILNIIVVNIWLPQKKNKGIYIIQSIRSWKSKSNQSCVLQPPILGGVAMYQGGSIGKNPLRAKGNNYPCSHLTRPYKHQDGTMKDIRLNVLIFFVLNLAQNGFG